MKGKSGLPAGARSRAHEVAAIALVIPLLLGNQGGCGHSPPWPPVVVRIAATLPEECAAPALPEPKLPDADVTDDVAARDRDALKRTLRRSEALRSICRAALEGQDKGG